MTPDTLSFIEPGSDGWDPFPPLKMFLIIGPWKAYLCRKQGNHSTEYEIFQATMDERWHEGLSGFLPIAPFQSRRQDQ